MINLKLIKEMIIPFFISELLAKEGEFHKKTFEFYIIYGIIIKKNKNEKGSHKK